MHAGFIYASRLSSIRFSPDHPFRPDRGQQCRELCDRYNLLDPERVAIIEPPPASEADLLRFHTPELVAHLKAASGGGAPSLEMLAVGLGTAENPVFEGLWDFVRLSTGATLEATRRVAGRACDVAFNPVGGFHHAYADHCEGFCYQNDIVIAALELLAGGLRPAVVDLDAHHGNGTQAAFYADPRVLTVSLHQDGRTLYPWGGGPEEWGEGPGEWFSVNVPLPEGADDAALLRAFEAAVPRALAAFRPDVVLLQIGADMHRQDPLTGLCMTNRSHRACVARVAALCPRVVALGGGGYNVPKTVRTWALAWATLTGLSPTDEYAGLVGNAMYGADSGDLEDPPFVLDAAAAAPVREALDATLAVVQTDVLPRLERACASAPSGGGAPTGRSCSG